MSRRHREQNRRTIRASMNKLVGREITLKVPIEIKAAVEGDGELKVPTFSMVAYNGGPLLVAGWDRRVVIDLEGLEVTKSRPVLKDHDAGRVVGHTTTIDIATPKLLIDGVVSGKGDDAREVTASAKDGFPWQASVGVSPRRVERLDANQKATVNGIEHTGPLYITRQGFLREVSVVSLGADDDTSVAIAAQSAMEGSMSFEDWAAEQGFDLSALSEDAVKNLQALFALWQADQEEDASEDTEAKAKKSGDAKASATGAGNINASAGGSSVAATIANDRKIQAAELKRVHAIQKLAIKNPDIAAQAIEEGWSEDKTELHVLRAGYPTAPTIIGAGGSGVNTANLSNIYAASICIEAGVPQDILGKEYGEQTMNAAMKPENRRVDFTRIAREVLAHHGERMPFSRLDDGVLRKLKGIEAYASMQRSINAASGSNLTPISMSGILGDSARKALVAGFLKAETTCPKVAQVQEAPDFKKFTWYRMVGIGQFQKLSANGNFQATQLKESSFNASLDTAGTIISLGRQEFINDDLGAFLNIPSVYGRQAAVYQDKEFFKLLLSNPSSFFSAGNGNYWASANSVLGIDALTTVTQMFLELKDENGDPIGLGPKYLLVPPALKGLADMIYKSPNLVSGNTGKVPSTNIYAGSYEVISSPFLGTSQGLANASDTAYYLLGDPGIAAVGVIAYLQGSNRSPSIMDGEWQTSKLALDFTVYFDFGCGMAEKKAGVMSKGAA